MDYSYSNPFYCDLSDSDNFYSNLYDDLLLLVYHG